MKELVTSFRGRLTLWSMVVLGLALVAFAVILSVVSLNRMLSGIDRELRDRALRSMRPPRAMGMGGAPPGALPRQGQDGPPPERGGSGSNVPRPGGGFGGPIERRPDLPPPLEPGEPGAEFLLDLRRPRFIDEKGQILGGFFENKVFNAAAVQDALRGRESYTTVRLEGQPIRVFTAPWSREGEEAGAIQVARDLKDYEALRATQTTTLLTLLPLALLATAAGAFLLVGRGLTPLAAMRSAAISIGEGDLSQRLQIKGSDELAQLGRAFNEMAQKLQLSFDEQRQAFKALEEAYESQRRFTADASHELRTPLARLQLATSSALSGLPEEYKSALEKADAAAHAMSKLVRQLLTLARADAGQLGLHKDVVDLRLIASNAANSLSHKLVVQLASAPVLVDADEDHLERCVLNILENAVSHTDPEGEVKVTVEQHDGEAVLEISDQGKGIAAQHLPHIFERFYRVEASRGRSDGGAGLGLAICKSIVEAHSGTIEVDSTEGVGTTFTIRLPLSS